jgi:AraC family transcriptional regulator, regulatory protein of adaptative response / methylated-DNA-[protein]-cysteine methyltransferase
MRTDYEKVQQAIEYVQAFASEQPTLEQIAQQVSLSPAHFQRVFRRWAGVSPKRWLQYLNAAQAKRLLRDSMPILETAFAVGLSGPGRLHDLIVSTEAMTPGEYAEHGAGVVVRYGWHDSPFGHCLIGMTERGICALRFADATQFDAEMDRLQGEWSQASLVKDQKKTAPLVAQIFESGRRRQLLLNLKGTNFQLRVWQALLQIPEGCVTSYGDLANRLDVPTASRAVANAIGANPVAFLIPCHRVLRATGELGGYRWGIERKAAMLVREFARSKAQADESQ